MLPSTEESLADFCIEQGLWPDGVFLRDDSKMVAKYFFAHFRNQEPELFASLDEKFTEEKAIRLTDRIGHFFKERLVTLLEDQRIPLAVRQIAGIFAQERLPTEEENNSFILSKKEMDALFLAQKRERTGIEANSLEELEARENRRNLERYLTEKVPENFSVEAFFEHVVTKPFFRYFIPLIKDEVAEYEKVGVKSHFLKIFDQLIGSYVSKEHGFVWLMNPESNYCYHIPKLEDIPQEQSGFMEKRLETSCHFLTLLEDLLVGVQELQKFLPIIKKHLNLILYANTEELLNFLTTKEDSLSKQAVDPRITSALTGFFIFYSKHVLELADNKELLLNLNIRIVLEYSAFLDGYVIDKAVDEEAFDAAFREFLEYAFYIQVGESIKAKEGGRGNVPLLGIGFSGRGFEPLKENIRPFVYLKFTEGFFKGKDKGTSILYGLKQLYEYPWARYQTKDKDLLGVRILHGTDSAATLLNYIAGYVTELLSKAPNSIYPDVKNSFKAALIDRVQKSAKLNKIPEKRNELVSVLKSEAILTKENREILQSLIKEGETRVCVETVISQASGNGYTLSFAMGPGVATAVTSGGNPYVSCKRVLVQPCETRCQLMASAHTLLADLIKAPVIQELDDRLRARGAPGIERMDPALIAEAMQKTMTDMQDCLIS